jgi:hypothetical protein
MQALKLKIELAIRGIFPGYKPSNGDGDGIVRLKQQYKDS